MRMGGRDRWRKGEGEESGKKDKRVMEREGTERGGGEIFMLRGRDRKTGSKRGKDERITMFSIRLTYIIKTPGKLLIY